jgi:sugar lactone lactonase YvrE
MRYVRQSLITLLLVVPVLAVAQDAAQPTNDAPNNYNTIKDYFKLPEGRTWGSTSAVDIDKDGTSIWVAERCGPHTPSGNSCLDRTTGKMSDLPSVLKFDSTGKLVKSFGAGLLIFPHGIHVDKDGNVWVTDGQDDAPLAARGAGRGAAPAGPIGPRPGATHGNQVFKFSPDGKVLLTLGKPGGAATPDYFYQPNDVITASNGDIFVSEGHGAGNNRVLKFDKTGKFIKEWGKLGTGPGEFDQPHALAFDSKGLLYVGDRNNNRVQVFDQNGTFIKEYTQWSRPSGIFIKDDILYSADSESGSVSRNHYGWQRGLRWGAIKDGKIIGFIPDPETGTNKDTPPFGGTSAAEGVAVDKNGNIYGAEVGPKAVKKYTKK